MKLTDAELSYIAHMDWSESCAEHFLRAGMERAAKVCDGLRPRDDETCLRAGHCMGLSTGNQMKRITDTERLDWLERHQMDWDPGMGAYFVGLNLHPPSKCKTLRQAVDHAMMTVWDPSAKEFDEWGSGSKPK